MLFVYMFFVFSKLKIKTKKKIKCYKKLELGITTKAQTHCIIQTLFLFCTESMLTIKICQEINSLMRKKMGF